VTDLLRKPTGTTGKVHDITPETAGWGYVGFGLYRLAAGETVAEPTRGREVILVLVEGKAEIGAGDKSFGEMGDRMDVFEKTPPHCVYVPNASDWSATATTACTLAVCSAPGMGGHEAQVIGPEGILLEPRGKGAFHKQYRDGKPRRRRQPAGYGSVHAAGQLVFLSAAPPRRG
jgi:5-deoxy-glucuronate isomerase